MRREGAVNVDISAEVGADVVHDLNCVPWPFDDGQFGQILCATMRSSICYEVPRVLEEIHRVSRRGALLCVTVPQFSSANAFTDLTHRHYFSWRSFDPYVPGDVLDHDSRARFGRRSTQRSASIPGIVNRIVFRLANRWPERYERRWAWMFPAWFLYDELEVVK